MGNDYYKTLGVDESASADEIKKQFRKLAKQYHPDRHKGDKACRSKALGFRQVTAGLTSANICIKVILYGQRLL
jgi:DnaJ-class molecular chaperone